MSVDAFWYPGSSASDRSTDGSARGGAVLGLAVLEPPDDLFLPPMIPNVTLLSVL